MTWDDAGVFTEGYIDKSGKELTEERFDEARQFSEGLGLVRRATGWGYVDTSGRIVIPLEYHFAASFSEGWRRRPRTRRRCAMDRASSGASSTRQAFG